MTSALGEETPMWTTTRPSPRPRWWRRRWRRGTPRYSTRHSWKWVCHLPALQKTWVFFLCVLNCVEAILLVPGGKVLLQTDIPWEKIIGFGISVSASLQTCEIQQITKLFISGQTFNLFFPPKLSLFFAFFVHKLFVWHFLYLPLFRSQ